MLSRSPCAACAGSPGFAGATWLTRVDHAPCLDWGNPLAMAPRSCVTVMSETLQTPALPSAPCAFNWSAWKTVVLAGGAKFRCRRPGGSPQISSSRRLIISSFDFLSVTPAAPARFMTAAPAARRNAWFVAGNGFGNDQRSKVASRPLLRSVRWIVRLARDSPDHLLAHLSAQHDIAESAMRAAMVRDFLCAPSTFC